MAPWAPPFKVACRICYQIEGKLKNYKNDRFYIKAYECLTGYQFEEVPYLNHFCPSCACMLKRQFRFKRQCRWAHYFLMDYMNAGGKVSRPYILRMQEYRLKSRPVQLKVWRSENQTIVDCVHATKRYKPKPKVVYGIGVSHLSVPKDPAEESWHFRAIPKDPFWSDYGPSDESEFDDEERMIMGKNYLHAERYKLPYEDKIGTLNMPVPVERTGGGSSRVALGSNPAMTSQPVRPMARIATYSEVEASKRNSGYIDYQPQPSTSNSDIRPMYVRNQIVQLTSTPLPLTEENVLKHNTEAILMSPQGLYRCHFCSLRFKEQNSLDAHLKVHQGPSYQTPQPLQAMNAAHIYNYTLRNEES